MFDAHRHISSDGHCDQDALYATSTTKEWDTVPTGMAVLSLGALASGQLPPPSLLYDRLKADPRLQIGEVGLDRRFPDLGGQRRFLEEVLAIGWELGRSVSLHCVRADGELLALLAARKGHLPPLIWHGCTASRESRMEAGRLGVIISYGPRLYSSKIGREGSALLATEWVLESDWEGEEALYAPFLEEHIRSFARLTGLSEESVVENNRAKRAILTNQPTPR
ncbi:MAG TPA: TatD family hydrolase [Sphaerochaeta sp.]|jgi:TatD DNase family protein|nr:TatD family hydrolase [Sphaerochaeta sp.]HPZ15228.1 TatD family hydrolase [Sphaerochaeta sp.]